MDEKDLITRKEHEEFVRRMDEANSRQSKRLEIVEKDVRQIGSLTTAVEKLAFSMENMVREQMKQGERLDQLESRDGEMWRKVTSYIVTAIVGAVVCYIMTRIGM